MLKTTGFCNSYSAVAAIRVFYEIVAIKNKPQNLQENTCITCISRGTDAFCQFSKIFQNTRPTEHLC